MLHGERFLNSKEQVYLLGSAVQNVMILFSDIGCNESLWALLFCDRQAVLVLMDNLTSLCFVLGRRVEGMSF